MKNLTAFQDFYSAELATTVQELHTEKQALLRKEASAPSQNPKLKALTRIVILVSIPIVLILLFTLPFSWFVLLMFFYVPACYMTIKVGGRMGVSELGTFRQKYKDQIIQKIIGFFNYDFAYSPLESVEKDAVNQSLIFPKFAHGIIGEDHIKGTIKKTTFEFSEIFALSGKEPTVVHFFVSEEQKKNNKLKMMNEFNSLMAKMTNPFFRGLFFIADFHKDFSCTAVVRPQKFEWGNKQLRDNYNRSKNQRYRVGARLTDEIPNTQTQKKLEQVHLEDPEFESIYHTYSDDQVMSRYILSTGMMQRIKDFRAKTGKEVFLSFKDSNMYLAIPYTRSLLEPKGVTKEHINEYLKAGKDTAAVLNEELADENHIIEFFTDLHFIFSIVEDFNLNTRIWTKK